MFIYVYFCLQLDSFLMSAIMEAVKKQYLSPSPRSLLMSPEDTTSSVKVPKARKVAPACKTCKQRRTEAKLLRKKLRVTEGELEKIKTDLELTEDVLDLKVI